MNRNQAKRLRRQITEAEQLLWRHLRGHRLLGQKFRRQQPIGDYVVDFVHFGANLVVEADGGRHAENQTDTSRDAWLQEKGFKVLRFWNNDILTNTPAVLERILEEVGGTTPLSPDPSPSRGEGRQATDSERLSASRRPIRSFVLRQGRMTEAQRRALEELWPRYGIDLGDAPIDPARVFARAAPLILEIGFGNGDALAAVAAAHPEQNFLGVDVHRPGVGSLLLKLAAAQLDNVRLVAADVNELLARLPAGALHGVRLFFPDPWPKKRHHKRRLLQPHFAAKLYEAVEPGGYLHCATDWDNYAEHMLDVLEAAPGWVNAAGPRAYAERPASRPETRFERRGRQEGRPARDLLFRRD